MSSTEDSGGQTLGEAMAHLQAENRDLAENLETLYRMNRELEAENEKLKQQMDQLLDRLGAQTRDNTPDDSDGT